MPRARTLKLLLVCLLAASWLGAGNAAWAKVGERIPRVKDAAPGINPKNAVHRYGDPCPDNITVDTWEQSSSLWRYTYDSCKPKGAPARHATNWEDLEHFLKENCFFGGDKRKHRIIRGEWAADRCIVSVLYEHDPIDIHEASDLACNIVDELILYFKTNGIDPLKERIALIARVYNENSRTQMMFAFFDYNIHEGKVRFMEIKNTAVPVDIP